MKYNQPPTLLVLILQIVIQNFYIFHTNHHNKSSDDIFHHSEILLIIDCSPHCTFHTYGSLYDWKSVPLDLSHLFLSSLGPLYSGHHLFVLCLTQLLFYCVL